jgi:hypothetical protein
MQVMFLPALAARALLPCQQSKTEPSLIQYCSLHNVYSIFHDDNPVSGLRGKSIPKRRVTLEEREGGQNAHSTALM